MQRVKFIEAENIINEKRLLHSEVMKRGIEFLAEVELGKLPPLEYAVRSIQGGQSHNNDTGNSINVPTVVSK